MRALAQHIHRRILHRDLRAEVGVHPFHGRVLVRGSALGDQVVDVGRPVLDRRVAGAAALLHDDLDDRAVQRVGRVGWRRAAFDVVHVGAFVHDDQCALELAHVLRVDAEVGLQRHVHVHARRHVDERTTRPDGAVQGRELVVRRRDDRAKVLLDDVGMQLQRRVHVGEQHALFRERLFDRVIDRLGLVLRANARQELLLGFRNAKPVEGALHVRGHLVPVLRALLGGLEVIVDVLEVDRAQVGAPGRERLLFKDFERAQAELAHPVRLALHPGDFFHDLFAQALLGLEDVLLGVEEAVLLPVG